MFGQRLRQARLAKDLTQERLEDLSGVTLSQINRIELGKVNPTINTIFRLARTLEIEPRELFDFNLLPTSDRKEEAPK